MVPHFTVSFAANLPGVLHSLEPRIIGDEKMRHRNNAVKFRLAKVIYPCYNRHKVIICRGTNPIILLRPEKDKFE